MVQSPWRVSAGEVPWLIEQIFSSHRRHSLTVISPAGDTGRPRLDVNALAARVEDLPTDLVVLDSMAASDRLSDSIGSAFRCFGGSVRVVMPGARTTDHFRRHPLILIYPEDDPGLSLRRVVEAAERTPAPASDVEQDDPPAPATEPVKASQPMSAPTPAQRRPAPKPGPHRWARDSDAPAGGASKAPAPPIPAAPAEPVAASPAQISPAPARDTDGERVRVQPAAPVGWSLEELAEVVSRSMSRVLEEQLGGPSHETERERSRAETAEELAAAARERIARLEVELEKARGERVLPVVFDDPERQLRWELETRWLMGTPQAERDANPLKAWSIGPDLLRGFEVEVVPRERTIMVMVAILAGGHWNRHPTHPFLESPGGKQRVSPEQSPIWRTHVKEHTPQAARLTWWTTRAGGVHFEHVGAHDDLL